jgi:hypothetical protein
MVCRIKNSPSEQFKAERKRFLQRQKGKPVLAEQIKSREERAMRNHNHMQDQGKEKRYVSDLQ